MCSSPCRAPKSCNGIIVIAVAMSGQLGTDIVILVITEYANATFYTSCRLLGGPHELRCYNCAKLVELADISLLDPF